MDKTENQTHVDSCLNCSHPIQTADTFCAHCGQMARSSRISIWSILSEFFSNVFNLDSRFFKSLRYIFLPSRLPKEYMDGKRRSYINPARFFFVTLVLHFAVLAFVTKDISINDGNQNEEIANWKRVERVALSQKFDSLAQIYPFENKVNQDSIKSILFEHVKDPHLDSTSFMNISLGNIKMGKKISNYDMLVLEPDVIIEDYEIEGYWAQLLFKQVHKLKKSPKAGFQFFIGNGLWVIIFLTIFSAFFLKLLYIRRAFFLVDHLVVSMYYHSVILILLSLIYGLDLVLWSKVDDMTFISTMLFLIMPLYGFLTLKKYYKQGFFKTFIKFVLLGFYEIIMLSIFVMIVILVSAMLF